MRRYDKNKIQEGLNKSILITLSKKPGASDFIRHQTIIFMSHMINTLQIIIMIQMHRVHSRIKAEIGQKLLFTTLEQGMQFS